METACSPDTTYMFFDQNNGRYVHKKAAQELCRTCPSVHLCSDAVMAQPIHSTKGIWAGMGESERVKLRRIRRGNADDMTKILAPIIREVAEDVEQETMLRVQALLSP